MKKLPVKTFLNFVLKRYKLTTSVFRRRQNQFETLVETILSQNTNDTNSSRAARRLFAVANTPKTIANLETRKLRKLIYSSGYYKQKAKKIREASKMILKKFHGRVPDNYNDLVSLPGVGDKTASVVLNFSFGKPFIPVDTHVARVSKRLQYACERDNPKDIRRKLENLTTPKYYQPLHLGMIMFGRDICHKSKPKCYLCPFTKYCLWYAENRK